MSRIAQMKEAFKKMKNTLCVNSLLPMTLRKRVLQCYIEPIRMYGRESWTMNKQSIRSLEATEMWFYRRMMRIPWTAKMTNAEVLNEAKTQRKLINIRKSQSSFLDM